MTVSGCDVNAADRYACTPLNVAAKQGNTTVVGELIKAGADINKTNSNKTTPILGKILSILFLRINVTEKYFYHMGNQTHDLAPTA